MIPSVNINITNGNLGIQPPSSNGVTVILVAAPAAPTAGYGVAFSVISLAQVKAAFAHADNAPVVEAFEKGFFAEASEGTKVYVLAMAPSTPLATLLAATNADKALILAGGEARLLAAIKFPPSGYVPTITDGFDEDVHDAVTAAQNLATAWASKNLGFRFFVEGFGATSSAEAKDYSTQANRNGAIVVAKVAGSSAIATLLAAGRASKVQPQENIGKIKTGSLNIAAADSVYITGTTKPENESDANINQWHTKRYITMVKNEIASGYVFADDITLTTPTDDYNNLRYGRVIDNAQRVAFAAYYEELKDDVEVDENGRLATVQEKALEQKIESAIDAAMRNQLSKKDDGTADVVCLVNPNATEYAALYAKNNVTPNFNIIQSETVYLFVFLRPKGCLKYINVYLGLTATAV